MSEIRLPSLGADMEEATLLEWRVKPGDQVEFGTILALLDTEKAEIEMESFVSGTIEALLIEPGQTVDVGTPVATYTEKDAPAEPKAPESAPAVATESVEREPTPSAPAPPDVSDLAPAPPSPLPPSAARSRVPPAQANRPRATPLARRLAAERGLDLATLHGSGPHGAITEADLPPVGAPAATREENKPVAPAAPREENKPVAPAATREENKPVAPAATAARTAPDRAARRREIIAAAMARSKREIPHYYLGTSIDVGPLLDRLAAYNEDRPADERLLLPVLLAKAVALAARRFPDLNGHYLEDGFHPANDVHLGMVVSLRTGGIIVPTLPHADERGLDDLMGSLRDLVRRARAGRLRSGELGDATITLTSLGEGGAETIFGVIYPPQVAIVGVGGVHPCLRAEGDLHGVGRAVQATLSGDHRASDGLQGSRFLEAVARSLTELELP